MNLENVWQRISVVDDNLCLLVNRASHRQLAARFFRLVSRLGDGVFWYSLMAVLPLLYGWQGAKCSAIMLVVGLINLLIYRRCKSLISRERPYVSLAPVHLAGVPLDRYSFPSGHTLHAVGFSVVVTSAFPALAVVLYPVAFLVALSRPLLGLHYPSDVLLAAVTGYGVAHAVIAIVA